MVDEALGGSAAGSAAAVDDGPATGGRATAGGIAIPPGFESALADYPIRVADFEGPLDLLLHLIRKNEVNVYDIPIVLITDQYLEYLGLMQELDLDVAGEFLVMAATLIHIKSRMLVPRLEREAASAEESEDPRDALVRRLIDHQRFKAAAEMLHERETVRSAQWTRPDDRLAAIAGEKVERELEVDLFSLLQAFQAVLARARERPPMPLPADVIPIETRIEQLLGRLSETKARGFDELFEDASSRSDLITTFLALLEMIRLKLIRVFQPAPFDPIRVYRRARPADAPRPTNDPEEAAGTEPRP